MLISQKEKFESDKMLFSKKLNTWQNLKKIRSRPPGFSFGSQVGKRWPQRSAGILRDWPQARGMFQTETSQLLGTAQPDIPTPCMRQIFRSFIF